MIKSQVYEADSELMKLVAQGNNERTTLFAIVNPD